MAKQKLSFNTLSDHMVVLRAFQHWQKAKTDGFEKSFCNNNFVSSSTMEMIVGMRAQLLGQLRASGFVRARGNGDIRDLNCNSENWAVVKAALCAGAYPSLIRVDRQRKQLITQKESKVRFHPSSVLNSALGGGKENFSAKNRRMQIENVPSDWFIFDEMSRIGRVSYARCCTIVSPITVAVFAGPARLPIDALSSGTRYSEHDDSLSDEDDYMPQEKACMKIDDWLTFRSTPEILRLAFPLRQKWHTLFLRRMAASSKNVTPADDMILKTIVEVLSAEEQSLELQQPVGVGQRPRPMATDYCPPVSNTSLHSPGQRTVSGRGSSRFYGSSRGRSGPSYRNTAEKYY